MQSLRTKKLQSEAGIRLLIILFIFILFNSKATAQNYRFTFRNTPLSEALVTISGKLDVRVAFDSKKLSLVNINKDVSGNNADEIIADILLNTGFGFRYKYNRYLIIDATKQDSIKEDIDFQLIGSVSDSESGEYLPYATVIVYDNNLQISASEKGSFSINNISYTPLHLLISYIGYNQLDTTIQLSNQLNNLELKLNKQMLSLDTIIVKGERNEMIDLRNDVDFATIINMSKLTDLPTLAETDIFRMLQLIPGINYGENSQGLSIRGGSTDQNLVLFDGQTLYNLSHYYGLISALNPNVVKDVQVYKGGYDSRFGERVSGIVDISGKTGNQTKPMIYGDLNLFSGNLTAELPVGKKISFIGAVRRSYSDIYSTNLFTGNNKNSLIPVKRDSNTIVNLANNDFYFYDYNAKLTFRPDNLESFTISLFGGKDVLSNLYSGSSAMLLTNSNDNNTLSNKGLSASWSKQWNGAVFTNIQAGTSGFENKASNSTELIPTTASDIDPQFLPDSVNLFNTYNQNKLQDMYLLMRNSFKTETNNQIDFGFLIRQNKIYYHKDADKEYVYDNLNQSGLTASGYVQGRIAILDNLVMKPGVRLNYFNNSKGLYTEPRFSVNYNLTDKLSVRIATGRYYQFINQVVTSQETSYNKNFWIMSDDWLHPVVTSNHFVGGMTVEKGKFLLDVEIYYKTYSGLQENITLSPFLRNSDFPEYFPEGETGSAPVLNQPLPSVYLTGTGRSFGVDFLLKYKATNFNSWLSYSFGRSLRNFTAINAGLDIPALNDQPYQLTLTNMFSPGKWNLSSIMYYSTGRPYIDYSSSNVTLPLIRNYKRLPDSFRTDLSANYNFSISGINLKTGLTVVNVFNSHNYLDINTRKFDFENNSFSEATLIRAQPFSVNLFLHFVF